MVRPSMFVLPYKATRLESAFGFHVVIAETLLRINRAIGNEGCRLLLELLDPLSEGSRYVGESARAKIWAR